VSQIPEQLNIALENRYRIERELGAGGMATVWLAHDERHGRRVALKVLRPELAAVIGAERFLNEIRTTANLQHPHILPLHDSGTVDGTVFYVMPFVEGESLRDRLNREKQLPVEDAIRITREVASALDYAHRRNVIHRDIKPENILLHDGAAMVADFGIALAVSSAGGATRMTETGMSLGTPHYMSPEQAMGERDLTARSDVYALGCVLYEMLVGEPPFTGPTPQAIVARVLTDAPRSLRVQRQTIPAHVEAAVHRALQKLPADRFGSAAELSTALGDASFRSEAVSVSVGAVPGDRRWKTAAYALAAVGVALGVVAAWGWLRPVDRPTSWTFISHGPGAEGTFRFGDFAIAPDGESYVYAGPDEGGTTQLWMKRRSELHAMPVRGTRGAFYPFFSPNGQWLAFYSGDRVMKMPASGGAPAPIATGAMIARWAAWLPNDKIVLGSAGYGFAIVDAGGGPVESLFSVRQSMGAYGAATPVALPGARGDFVFAMCTPNCAARQMWVYDASAADGRPLLEDAYPIAFAEGHLLYGFSGALFAAPFNLDRLEFTGTGIPVLDNVLLAQLSATGSLLYTQGSVGGFARVELVTRDGIGTAIDTSWAGNFAHVSVSPDGRRVAVDQTEGDQQSILIREIEGGTVSRLPNAGRINMRPVWHPDGTRIAWTSPQDSTSRILVRRADGVGAESQLISNALAWEAEWSPDAEWVVYRRYGDRDADDLYAVRTRGDTTPIPIATSPFYERAATISRDGRYVAYVSNESGRDEVYVRPFPDVEAGRWVVSVGGGTEPRWSPLGNELFYIGADDVVQAVPVTLGARFTHAAPRSLFSASAFNREVNSRAYDVMPDGKRFVMLRNAPATYGAPILVENWVAEFRRKLKQ
jgi:Tol biopolymer transport system component